MFSMIFFYKKKKKKKKKKTQTHTLPKQKTKYQFKEHFYVLLKQTILKNNIQFFLFELFKNQEPNRLLLFIPSIP
jgi:hypothetical protein